MARWLILSSQLSSVKFPRSKPGQHILRFFVQKCYDLWPAIVVMLSDGLQSIGL